MSVMIIYDMRTSITTSQVASSIFWRSILPYFWKIMFLFLATTIRTLFDENSSNLFYIGLYVQILNQLFCLFQKVTWKYIFIKSFNKYMRTKLPMKAVQNSQTADGGRSK